MVAQVTPSLRSRKALEADGWEVETVEHYNFFTKRRHDLFGFADLLAIKPGRRRLVQATSLSNVSARVRKIADHPKVTSVRAAEFEIVVHGWGKRGGKWVCREVDCS